MLLVLILACLAFGVYLVAAAQRGPTRAERLEKVGGGLVVVGLIGLGYMVASQR